MEHRKLYPPRSMTPEHDSRPKGDRDLSAAYAYVDGVRDTSDFTDPAAWHGWALREAFLAGVTHGRKGQK